jgi:hypothetical protein
MAMPSTSNPAPRFADDPGTLIAHSAMLGAPRPDQPAASCDAATNRSRVSAAAPLSIVSRERDALGERRRPPADDEPGAGVEHDDVAVRTDIAGEHPSHGLGVLRGLAAREVGVPGGSQTEVLGIDAEVRDVAVTELDHVARPGRGQLVEATTVHDPGVDRPVAPERLDHPLGERRVGDADDLAADASRIRHRTEQVEHGRDADLAPRRGREAERRVERRGEAEADAGGPDAVRDPVGRQLDGDTERLEHVGGAALRRGGPGAVLAHGHPGTRGHDRRHRRHVDRVGLIAAGPDDVDRRVPQVVTERHDRGVLEHGVEQAGELGRGLTLGAERDHEPDQLCRRRVAAQDRVHRRPRLLGGQVGAVEQRAQQRAATRRGRRSRPWPGAYGTSGAACRSVRGARWTVQALRRR